jgi:hypothetical protein
VQQKGAQVGEYRSDFEIINELAKRVRDGILQSQGNFMQHL